MQRGVEEGGSSETGVGVVAGERRTERKREWKSLGLPTMVALQIGSYWKGSPLLSLSLQG